MPYATASDALPPTDKRGKLDLADVAAIAADKISLLKRTADAAERDYAWNEALREKLSGVAALRSAQQPANTPMQILIDSPTTTHVHPPQQPVPPTTWPSTRRWPQLALAAAIGATAALGSLYQLGKTPYIHTPPPQPPAAAYELRLDVGSADDT
jgi:hypothetical protein